MDFPLFIGFTHMESWLASIDKKRPVFAALAAEIEKETNEQRTERLVITVAQPIDGEMVYYCRLPVGILNTMVNIPINNHDQRIAIAESAYQLVFKWLVGKHLKVNQGVVAAPKNTQYLDGKASFLVFDHQTQQYTNAKKN